MSNTWVDFHAVKAAVPLKSVLEKYGVTWLQGRGDELHGRCPIHKGESADSFHVNLTKHCFQCFVCKARGNVLDFCAAMEKCSIRDAAIKLQSWFTIGATTVAASQPTLVAKNSGGNKPLGYELKGLDTNHPYLVSRGVSAELAEYFGIGYFWRRGSMHGRVVIPIHNERGELLAYAGRSVDGTDPRYKFPTGFQKSAELFNLHRAKQANSTYVYVCEGFFGVLKLHAAGCPNAVAIMGSSMSDEQVKLLSTNFQYIALMFDADDAGERCTVDALMILPHYAYVTDVCMPADRQLDELTTEEIQKLIKGELHGCGGNVKRELVRVK